MPPAGSGVTRTCLQPKSGRRHATHSHGIIERQKHATRPWLVAVGNEERGLRRRTLQSCDELCRLPPGFRGAATGDGAVTSLNAAVAAGAILAALARPG